MSSRPILNYYGGKWNIAPWIIEKIPEHELYVEPFGGGASVLLRKQRSKREIYNDLDCEIVNLFKVARDMGPRLQENIVKTPFSRTEYITAYNKTTSRLERARRTIIKSYFGIGDSMMHTARSGMRTSKSSNTDPAKSWANYGDKLNEITERLRGVIIENLSYEILIDKYDSRETLFYFDPPYVRATRSLRHCYRYDFLDQDHITFIQRCLTLKGMAMVSGYDHPYYRYFEDNGWMKIQSEFISQSATRRTESLWICPKAQAKNKQIEMAL